MKSFIYSVIPALVAAGPGINPNPNPNFDPSTSQGTFGPFVPAQQALASANGGPQNVDPRSKQAMQLAISNWQTDTGLVSGFLNVGVGTTDDAAFKGIADGAFKAEVDELAQKAVLDQVIGNDPRVSIANLTLTNGVFQSVVDNLQIMSIQGGAKNNLVDAINQVRCTQILPSIDTYMVVAAEYIGDNAQQRRAVRPAACGQILAAAQNTDFPNVPGTPNGTPQGTGDGNVQGVAGACTNGVNQLASVVNNGPGPAGGAGGANTNAGNGNTGANTNAGNGNTGANTNAGNGNNTGANTNAGNTGANTNAGNGNTGSGANAPLANVTTPQLGGIVGGNSNTNNGGNTNANQGGNTNANQGGNTNANQGGNTNANQGANTNANQGANTNAGQGNGNKGGQAAAGQATKGGQTAAGQGKGAGAQAANGKGAQAGKGKAAKGAGKGAKKAAKAAKKAARRVVF